MRTLPVWAAMLVATVVTLLAWGLVVTAAVLVALWVEEGAIVATTGRVLLVWSTAWAILAFAGGGGLAARLAKLDREGTAAVLGAMTGLAALLIVVGTVGEVLGEQMDFHSIAAVLGYVEQAPAAEQFPFSIATPPSSARSTIDQHAFDRMRTFTTIAYAAILTLSLISAGAAGGWSAASWRR